MASTPPEKITIAFAPVFQNPYQHLLAAALKPQGVQTEYLDRMPSAGWLMRHRGQVQVLHLHWLYGLYMQRWLTPVRLMAFICRFWLAQKLQYRIVWTAHNILPHRQPFPPLHRAIRQLVMARADAVIVHCQYGRQELARLFPRNKPIHVVPIGNYGSVHAITVDRLAARSQLGIPRDAFVFFSPGNISVYKGIDALVAAFLARAEADDIVLIAGRNRAPALVHRLQELSADDPRIRLCLKYIPDDVMQNYLRAADVAVFAFRKILTSSSVILAMSYGLPVIAPALGCLPELVTPEAGILYDPAKADSLEKALSEIKTRDTVRMGQAAKAIAAQLNWDDIARQTAAIYRQCLENPQ